MQLVFNIPQASDVINSDFGSKCQVSGIAQAWNYIGFAVQFLIYSAHP